MQPFVAFDQGNLQPGCLSDLRIVAGERLPRSRLRWAARMSAKAEGLRRLHAAQLLARGAAGHQAAFSQGEAVDHRQDGNGRLDALSSVANRRSITAMRQIGAGGIVDQHEIGRCRFKRFQARREPIAGGFRRRSRI